MKTVYVGMCADLIHHGHINIIQAALKYGKVIIGLLSDSAIATYKNPPVLSYNHRKLILENIIGIDLVVMQNTLSYKDNLLIIRPNYVMHADDWQHGCQKETRQEVLDIIWQWNGMLIEIPYTKGISSTKLRESL